MSSKVILITGASGGIGFQAAKLFAQKKYRVYATSRNPQNSPNLIDLINRYPNVTLLTLDISNGNDCSECVKKIIKKEGKLDILLNCVAHVLFGPIETVSIKQSKDQFEVNFFGVIRLVQAVLPHMKKKRAGRIICLGSTSGVETSPMYGLYSASKFALESMMFALAANVHAWNIGVSIVELSATSTEICQKSLRFGEKNKCKYLEKYTKNAFNFLSEIIKNGESPEYVAEQIFTHLNQENPPFRYMATKRAASTFQSHLHDPDGKQLQQVIQEEKSWYEI